MKSVRKFLSVIVFSLVVLTMSSTAWAACTAPAGVEGEMVYNSTHEVYQFCNGSDQWISMGGGTGGGAAAIDDLSDVDTTGKAANDILTWDGTSWGAAAPPSGGSSAWGDLTGVPAGFADGTDDTGGGGVGDGDKTDITVSGSGATWAIDANAVTSAKIADGTVSNNDLAGSIALSKIVITGTPDGTKFLKDDGSWSVPAGGSSLWLNNGPGGPAEIYYSGGNIGIGTNDPNSIMNIVGDGGLTDDVSMYSYTGSNAAGWAPGIFLYRARGTSGSPAAVQAGDSLGQVDFRGHNGTAFVTSGSIQSVVDTTYTTTASTQDSSMLFYNLVDGVNAERMRIASNGNIGIGTDAPQKRLHVLSTLEVGTAGTGGTDQSSLDLVTLGGHNLPIANAASKGWQLYSRGNAFSTTAQQNDFGLSYWNGTAWIEGLTADSLTGNIGIKTVSPGTALDVTGSIRASGEIVGTTPTQLRMIGGNYGAILRNDGANTYLLYTASGDQYGTWNALQPFRVENATGDVSFVNGQVLMSHSNANMGIGTTPAADRKLDVYSATGHGVVGSGPSTGSSYYGVFGGAGPYYGALGRADGFSFVGNGALYNTGLIRSTSGGFMFPDGTTQTTAATGGGGGTPCSSSAVSAFIIRRHTICSPSLTDEQTYSLTCPAATNKEVVQCTGAGTAWAGFLCDNGVFKQLGIGSRANTSGKCSCLTADAMIAMADGSFKEIHKIVVGEKVKGADGSINTVLDLDRTLMWVGKDQHLIRINGEKEFMSDNHPVMTEAGWKAVSPEKAELEAYDLLKGSVGQLEVGDVIVMADGKTLPVKSIDIVPHGSEDVRLYNLHLDGTHNYYANGMLVYGNVPDKAGLYPLSKEHNGE